MRSFCSSYMSYDSSAANETCSEGTNPNTKLNSSAQSEELCSAVGVVKFYLEKSVHGGFDLQCVHIYKHFGDTDRWLTEDQLKCFPLLKTGQEVENNLLQFGI